MLKQLLGSILSTKTTAPLSPEYPLGQNAPIKVVTSFNAAGFNQYGGAFLESFERFWPQNFQLDIYAEEFVFESKSPRIEVFDLHAEIPKLREFKRRHAANPAASGRRPKGYDYRFDALRFANKSYVMCNASRCSTARYLLWLDGDTRSFLDIPTNFLSQILRSGDFLAYLGRIGSHTETGFLPFDLQHPCAKDFFSTLENIYENDTIFSLREWHDCEAIDACRAIFLAQGRITARNLNKLNSAHPFINSIPGLFMDHMKGPDAKEIGASNSTDYLIPPASRVSFGGRYKQLRPLVRHFKPCEILEVGTWSGWRAVQMALISLESGLDVRYKGFDVFEDFTTEFDAKEMNVKPHFSKKEVKKLLSIVADLYPKFSFELVQGDTNQTLKDETADFVFLDGGHSFETILNDFEAVKNSSVILLDDYYAGPIDTDKFGCNRVIQGLPHQVLPIADPVKGGGTTQFALVHSVPLPPGLLS